MRSPPDRAGLALVAIPDHAITPQPGTVVKEADGKPGNLLAVFDYPLRAECITCGHLVRIQRKFFCEWEHVIPQQTAPAER